MDPDGCAFVFVAAVCIALQPLMVEAGKMESKNIC
jgi:hypothetical protein